MKHSVVVSLIAVVALSLGAYLLPSPVQAADEAKINGFTIVVPQSSIPHAGRIHTNYFFARSDVPNTTGGPPPGTETPGSLACVYKLVKGPKGCPISASTTVPRHHERRFSLREGLGSLCRSRLRDHIQREITPINFAFFQSPVGDRAVLASPC